MDDAWMMMMHRCHAPRRVVAKLARDSQSLVLAVDNGRDSGGCVACVCMYI